MFGSEWSSPGQEIKPIFENAAPAVSGEDWATISRAMISEAIKSPMIISPKLLVPVLLGGLHRLRLRCIDPNTGAHGGAPRHTLDIGALGRSRPGFFDRLHQRSQIIIKFLLLKRDFANRNVQVGGLVDAKLNAAGFRFVHHAWD